MHLSSPVPADSTLVVAGRPSVALFSGIRRKATGLLRSRFVERTRAPSRRGWGGPAGGGRPAPHPEHLPMDLEPLRRHWSECLDRLIWEESAGQHVQSFVCEPTSGLHVQSE